MTRQYLIGEAPLLLSRLHAEAAGSHACRQVERLRRQAETVLPEQLGPVLVQAAAVANRLCWEALDRGDVEAFERRSRLAEEIHTFGVCSGLIPGSW